MGREYCIHMVRIEDDCDDCVTYGGPGVWETARAWQAFRDFLNGTPEQWLRKLVVGRERNILEALGDD